MLPKYRTLRHFAKGDRNWVIRNNPPFEKEVYSHGKNMDECKVFISSALKG